MEALVQNFRELVAERGMSLRGLVSTLTIDRTCRLVLRQALLYGRATADDVKRIALVLEFDEDVVRAALAESVQRPGVDPRGNRSGKYRTGKARASGCARHGNKIKAGLGQAGHRAVLADAGAQGHVASGHGTPVCAGA